MKEIIILLAVTFFSQTAFAGERWVAKCTDGKNIHYVQKYKGVGHLFMEVESPFGRSEIFPIATLKQSKSTPISICGVVQGNQDPQGQPISQICMNRDRQIIYMKFDHPKQAGPIQDGVFCKADVKVVLDF